MKIKHSIIGIKTLSTAVIVAALAIVNTGCSTTCSSKKNSCSTKQSCSAGAGAQTKESQSAITPGDALDKLRAGNQRFVSGQPMKRDLAAQRSATAAGQFPYAVVLSCLDSRTSTEQVFDQGIGDVFNARVAGNVLNDDILGSMEFACKAAGAKLIAVVGHSKCGAVKGACSKVQLGNLTGLLDKIQPAVASTLSLPEGQKPTDAQVDAVAVANVKLVMKQINDRSPLLAEMAKQGQIKIVGGMYDLDTGVVKFLD